jgi:hypothetical protein
MKFSYLLMTLLACSGVGLAVLVKAAAGLSQPAAREKTLLDLRIESSREIREAFAKPVAGPEPLPPITTNLARGFLAAKPPRVKFAKEASDAFASSDWSGQSRSTVQYDRHTSNF